MHKSHYGFCIEFKSDQLEASEVKYKDKIPSIDMLDLINLTFENKKHKDGDFNM